MNKIIITLIAVLVLVSSLTISADAQYMGNVGSDYYDNLSPEELEEMQKRRIGGYAGCCPPPASNYTENALWALSLGGIVTAFVLGMIYWWRKK